MKKYIKQYICFLAWGLGAGLSPKAPGTMGTLVAIPLYVFISGLSPVYYISIVCFMGIMGIYICELASQYAGIPDHQCIVWDEIVGYLFTMFLLPNNWLWIILSFIFFRFFDILKPWPINTCDRKVKGGFGIMADDCLAAVYAGGILHFVLYLLHKFTL
jgi:phosphatidylglycerophosphatase A